MRVEIIDFYVQDVKLKTVTRTVVRYIMWDIKYKYNLRDGFTNNLSEGKRLFHKKRQLNVECLC